MWFVSYVLVIEKKHLVLSRIIGNSKKKTPANTEFAGVLISIRKDNS